MPDVIEGTLGRFTRKEGVLVYGTTSHCNLPQAAGDAISFKPSEEAAFFDFNGKIRVPYLPFFALRLGTTYVAYQSPSTVLDSF